ARGTALAVVVDDVVLDQRAGDDTIPAVAEVAVHVNAGLRITKDGIAADYRAVAAVGDIDAVLGDRATDDVVLDQRVVGETGEDAPGRGGIDGVVLDGDVVVGHRPDAATGDRAARVVDAEAVDDDVARPFQVDAVGCRRVAGTDHCPGVGLELDRVGGGP